MDEEKYKIIRNKDVMQRIMIFESLREKGNKHYHKGEYDLALRFYEHALGCFKWLEIVDEEETDLEDAESF